MATGPIVLRVTARLIAVIVTTLVGVLMPAAAMLAFLVLGMNGFSERQGERVFVAYAAVVLFTLIAECAAAARIDRWARTATTWPAWAIVPSIAFAMAIAAAVVLFISAMVLMMVGASLPR